MDKVDMDNAAGFISDESSYYGDEEVKSRWNDAEETFDPKDYWSAHPQLLNTVAYRQRQKFSEQRLTPVHSKDRNIEVDSAIKRTCSSGSSLQICDRDDSGYEDPYNPCEGKENARQLSETVHEFLKRVRPLDVKWSAHRWVRIANPCAERANRSAVDINTAKEHGYQLLSAYLERRQEVQAANPDKIVTRKLKPEREELKKNIEDLAVRTNVITGKWMLFPEIEDVPQVWRTVAEATAENRLGIGAKVATVSNEEEDDGLRVICVYTEDFRDIADIKRVVEGLADLGIVPRDGTRNIYYKSDIYTHLNITSTYRGNNPYSLKASLYSSKDVLATKRAPAPSKKREPPRKKQSTPSKSALVRK